MLTVTVQVAVLSSDGSSGVPLIAVAVMVAVPSQCAETTPFSSTVATAGLSDDHVIISDDLYVAYCGAMVGLSFTVVLLASISTLVLSSVISSTSRTVTFTVQVVDLSSSVVSVPLVAVAVIVAVPRLTGVTTPF